MNKNQLDEIISNHARWLMSLEGGERANLRSADLSGANLRSANLRSADLSGANLRRANLRRADLRSADLRGANLRSADLSGADLSGADLSGADLSGANLRSADLSGANLSGADLSGADGLIKLMGVCLGNRYYKTIGHYLINNTYTFTSGLNVLRDGEVFANDERVLCSSPGFHFASKSWCEREYGNRQYMCLIRIPTKEEYENIEINEPWATDGKASASAIIIEKIFDTQDGNKDVTSKFVNWADGKGNKL